MAKQLRALFCVSRGRGGGLVNGREQARRVLVIEQEAFFDRGTDL